MTRTIYVYRLAFITPMPYYMYRAAFRVARIRTAAFVKTRRFTRARDLRSRFLPRNLFGIEAK